MPELLQTTLRLANASGVTPRTRDFHSPGFLSFEKTIIFAIQGAHGTFAIGGVPCSVDSFVVAESFVLRIKFSGKSPTHRKSAKR